MLELAVIVQDVAGTQLALEFRPLPEDDPVQRRPDTRRARHNLEWEPSTKLREGLGRTVKDFRVRLKNGEPRP